MLRSALVWQEIVAIDRDIAEVCRLVDERGKDAPDLQALGEMLDRLMERKRELLQEQPPP